MVELQRSTPHRLWVELGFRATAQDTGLVVTELRPRSASARAGLRLGDRILAVDSATVRLVEDLSPLILGDQVGVRVRRTPGGVVLREIR